MNEEEVIESPYESQIVQDQSARIFQLERILQGREEEVNELTARLDRANRTIRESGVKVSTLMDVVRLLTGNAV